MIPSQLTLSPRVVRSWLSDHYTVSTLLCSLSGRQTCWTDGTDVVSVSANSCYRRSYGCHRALCTDWTSVHVVHTHTPDQTTLLDTRILILKNSVQLITRPISILREGVTLFNRIFLTNHCRLAFSLIIILRTLKRGVGLEGYTPQWKIWFFCTPSLRSRYCRKYVEWVFNLLKL